MRTLARQGDKSEVLARLRRLQAGSARRWGRMSAPEMVCHLSDSFLVATGEIEASLDSGLVNRTIVKWIALYAPLPWPPGIRTRPEVDPQRTGTRPGDFAADVARLEALVERIAAGTRSFDGHAHPIFGKLSHAAWLRWGYLHMDHHLRQFGL